MSIVITVKHKSFFTVSKGR